MSIKLTKRSIDHMQPREADYFVSDSDLTGFYLRVTPTGRKYFFLRVRQGETIQRTNLGLYGDITPEAARKQAEEKLKQTPAQKPKRQSITCADLIDRYWSEYVTPRCKPRTRNSYRYYLDKYIRAAFNTQPVEKITQKEISDFHLSLKHKLYDANRSLEILSKLFNLAELWGFRPDNTNPCRFVKKYKERKRERFLTYEELGRLTDALETHIDKEDESPSAVFGIYLLLLTGCRLSEIQTLKWDYIDLDQSIINLPDSKTGARTIYLNDEATDLLHRLKRHRRRPPMNPYVIWGHLPGQHITDMQRPWRRIRDRLNLTDVRLHDLRHSFASIALNNGMSLPMIGKLLGHTSPQTTARYAHLMERPLQEAADQVSASLADLMG